MAGGISVALITTAAGMLVQIPALMAYRYFRGKVNMLVLRMEQQTLRMVEILHGQRSTNDEDGF
jgi:biopolymer transport protein ExbB